MSRYTAPITRKEGRSFGRATHWYVDANGLKIPGVTSILSDGVPKPALVGWGIRTVAEYAVDHWDEVADLAPSERLKVLKGSPYADRDAAANRGTQVHALAEQLVQGAEVDVPDELAGHVESYVRFLDEWQPEPVLVERTVVNYTVGYAGTLDLVARFPCWPGETVLADLKTNRSGIYGETGLQLAAYRYAEFFVDDDGTEKPMPAIDRVVVVHVRADGYDVVPVRADDYVFTRFRHVGVVARATQEAKSWVGDALTPPALEASA
ncbi:MAG: hypothetical protein AB7H92_15650 [Microbacteriaceae bacterium]